MGSDSERAESSEQVGAPRFALPSLFFMCNVCLGSSCRPAAAGWAGTVSPAWRAPGRSRGAGEVGDEERAVGICRAQPWRGFFNGGAVRGRWVGGARVWSRGSGWWRTAWLIRSGWISGNFRRLFMGAGQASSFGGR